jgi:4-hydroxybenzoate polyprenyltransferase
MPPKRRHAWVGFAVFLALATSGLFLLDGPASGAVLLAAMLVLVGACIYALKGHEPDAIRHNERTGLAGWFGGWF